MFDPNQTDLDRDVESSMRMFRRAQVGPAAALEPKRPARVLLVLDGSPQDDSSVAAAAHLQHHFGTETVVLDATEQHDGWIDRAPQRSGEIPAAHPIQRGEGAAYDAILQAVQTHDTDLVVVPCPFGRDFESVGADSAGTVIDVLLSRCTAAMLVIRRADQPLDLARKEIALVIGSESERQELAARWMLGLAEQGAQLSLNLVVEHEHYENLRALMEVLAPEMPLEIEQVGDALAAAHKRLHASLTRSAKAANFRYALRPILHEQAPPSVHDAARPLLVVLPLEVDDRFEQGFVQDRIRRSPHPLLVVPSQTGGQHGD